MTSVKANNLKMNSLIKLSVKPCKFTSKLALRILKALFVSVISLAFVASPFTSFAKEQTLQNILVFGDSLSAAYGLSPEEGWAALLQKKLNGFSQTHFAYRYNVINASVSGETTSGGLTRLEAALKKNNPSIVILELGANDGLRGLPISEMQSNLEKMLQLCQKHQAKVLLLGMRIPPNYGAKYTQGFNQTYENLSKQYKTGLVPFMLNNIATKPMLIQQDGLHPNTLGQLLILENIWPQLLPILKVSALKLQSTK